MSPLYENPKSFIKLCGFLRRTKRRHNVRFYTEASDPATLRARLAAGDKFSVTRRDIYCSGSLLHTIQMARIFEDSKSFVDMKLVHPPRVIMANFKKFMKQHNDRPTAVQIESFVNDHFEDAGKVFYPWVPKDWIVKPNFVNKIEDEKLRVWALDLNLIWKDLGRKIRRDMAVNEELYSTIYTKHGFIIPGGRFIEYYYWDTYWIIAGLLLCEMNVTVKGILNNFMHIVNQFGYIPNGGRIYYLERSQPPMLMPMVKLYYDYTKDKDFLKENIQTMEKEFKFWMTSRCRVFEVKGRYYTLASYSDTSFGPRPEMYSEDLMFGELFHSTSKREQFYSNIKATAESGWDFSSRWFVSNGTNKGNLTDILTKQIVPVDLNAFIYWNAKILAEFNEILGVPDHAKEFHGIAENWLNSIEAVLWHEDVGCWLDYDLQFEVKRNYFYPSNVIPLFTSCYRKEKKEHIFNKVLEYLRRHNVSHPGGVPTSFEYSAEQWDYPNTWAPLQHMMVEGLRKTGNKHLEKMAFEIAQNWITTNYRAFALWGGMFEKYDCNAVGELGGFGEYKVQLGFGWSNGVVLDLLNTYGEEMKVIEDEMTILYAP